MHSCACYCSIQDTWSEVLFALEPLLRGLKIFILHVVFWFWFLIDSLFFPLCVDFHHLLWRRANTRNYHTLLSCFPVVIQFSLPGLFFAVKISWQKRQNTKFWIRCFYLSLQSTDPDSVDKREVVQYHFTSWPDHSVPRDTIAFLMFHHKLKTTLVADPGPVIIHCRSAVEIDIDSFIVWSTCVALICEIWAFPVW